MDQPTDKPVTHRFSFLVLLVLLLCVGLVGAWQEGWGREGVGFYPLWVVPRALDDAGMTGIYSRAAADAVEDYRWSLVEAQGHRYRDAGGLWFEVPVSGTPFLLTAARGLSPFGDYDRDLAAHLVISLVVFVLALYALSRLIGLTPAFGLVVALMFVMPGFLPFEHDVGLGSLSRILLALLALHLLATHGVPRPWGDLVGGLVLGLLVMLKPIFLLVVGVQAVSLAANHRLGRFCYRGLGTTAGMGAGFALSARYFGDWTCWKDWAAHVMELAPRQPGAGLDDHSAVMLLRESLGLDTFPWIVVASIFVASAIVYVARRGTVEEDGPGASTRVLREDWLAVSCGVLVLLLSMPQVQLHRYLLAVPVILLGFRPAEERETWRTRLPPALLGSGAFLLLALRPLEGIIGGGDPTSRTTMCVGGSVLLLMLAAWEAFTLRRPPEHGTSSAEPAALVLPDEPETVAEPPPFEQDDTPTLDLR